MKFLLLLCLSILPMVSLANSSVHQVSSQDELYLYWQQDDAKMNYYMPVGIDEVITDYDDDVTFRFRFHIDSEGVPSNFELLGADPAAAMAEKKKVEIYYLNKRYSKGKKNPKAQPVIFEGEIRWWNPNK